MTSTTAQGAVGYAALWVADPDSAARFFSAAMGWSYRDEGPLHRMIADVQPPQSIVDLAALPAGVWDGWPRHNTMFLSHAVDDVDAAVARIRAAGGHASDPTDEPHGRGASCTDDQGMVFAIHAGDGEPPATAAQPGRGRLAYLTLQVTDSARARTFFRDVFGWGFTPGTHADGYQIDGLHPMGGLHGGHDRPSVVPMYAVDDIRDTVLRIRAAGGTASEPELKPYGVLSSCADDQRTRFDAGQLG